jgi:hypothetical protein
MRITQTRGAAIGLGAGAGAFYFGVPIWVIFGVCLGAFLLLNAVQDDHWYRNPE